MHHHHHYPSNNNNNNDNNDDNDDDDDNSSSYNYHYNNNHNYPTELHRVCSQARTCTPSLLRATLLCRPNAAFMTDEYGRLPLHCLSDALLMCGGVDDGGGLGGIMGGSSAALLMGEISSVGGVGVGSRFGYGEDMIDFVLELWSANPHALITAAPSLPFMGGIGGGGGGIGGGSSVVVNNNNNGNGGGGGSINSNNNNNNNNGGQTTTTTTTTPFFKPLYQWLRDVHTLVRVPSIADDEDDNNDENDENNNHNNGRIFTNSSAYHLRDDGSVLTNPSVFTQQQQQQQQQQPNNARNAGGGGGSGSGMMLHNIHEMAAVHPQPPPFNNTTTKKSKQQTRKKPPSTRLNSLPLTGNGGGGSNNMSGGASVVSASADSYRSDNDRTYARRARKISEIAHNSTRIHSSSNSNNSHSQSSAAHLTSMNGAAGGGVVGGNNNGIGSTTTTAGPAMEQHQQQQQQQIQTQQPIIAMEMYEDLFPSYDKLTRLPPVTVFALTILCRIYDVLLMDHNNDVVTSVIKTSSSSSSTFQDYRVDIDRRGYILGPTLVRNLATIPSFVKTWWLLMDRCGGATTTTTTTMRRLKRTSLMRRVVRSVDAIGDWVVYMLECEIPGVAQRGVEYLEMLSSSSNSDNDSDSDAHHAMMMMMQQQSSSSDHYHHQHPSPQMMAYLERGLKLAALDYMIPSLLALPNYNHSPFFHYNNNNANDNNNIDNNNNNSNNHNKSSLTAQYLPYRHLLSASFSSSGGSSSTNNNNGISLAQRAASTPISQTIVDVHLTSYTGWPQTIAFIDFMFHIMLIVSFHLSNRELLGLKNSNSSSSNNNNNDNDNNDNDNDTAAGYFVLVTLLYLLLRKVLEYRSLYKILSPSPVYYYYQTTSYGQSCISLMKHIYMVTTTHGGLWGITDIICIVVVSYCALSLDANWIERDPITGYLDEEEGDEMWWRNWFAFANILCWMKLIGFLCKCNLFMGRLESMMRTVEYIRSMKYVVCSDIFFVYYIYLWFSSSFQYVCFETCVYNSVLLLL